MSAALARPGTRASRRLVAVVLVAATALLGACGGDVSLATGTARVGTTGGGGSSAMSALVGRWSRVVLLPDGYGGYATSETTWEFASDSVATRILVTRSPAFGVDDVEVRTARWNLQGGVIVIRYVGTSTGTVQFRWRIERHADGDLLFLDETAFARVSG